MHPTSPLLQVLEVMDEAREALAALTYEHNVVMQPLAQTYVITCVMSMYEIPLKPVVRYGVSRLGNLVGIVAMETLGNTVGLDSEVSWDAILARYNHDHSTDPVVDFHSPPRDWTYDYRELVVRQDGQWHENIMCIINKLQSKAQARRLCEATPEVEQCRVSRL